MISKSLHPLRIYCACTNDEGEILLTCAACSKRAYVSAGPKGEGGLDDATGASKSAGGGASMKQTSNTVNLGKIHILPRFTVFPVPVPIYMRSLCWGLGHFLHRMFVRDVDL